MTYKKTAKTYCEGLCRIIKMQKQIPEPTAISKVSFGFGAGGSEFGTRTGVSPDTNANFGGGSGGGATIDPVAFMVVGQGQIKLLPMDKNTSPIEDVIDKVPTLLDKLADLCKKKCCKKKKDDAEDVVIETIETVTVED